MTTAPSPRPEPTEPRRLRLIKGEGSGARQLRFPYEYEVAPGVPAIPSSAAPLSLVPTPVDDQAEPEPPATPSMPPAPAGQWIAQIARAIAEVASGERPPAQLTGHVSREEIARLSRRGQAVTRHPSSRASRGTSRLRAVRGLRLCQVAPGVVETSAVLVGNERAQAIAMRFEAVNDRWQATAVELR